MAGETAELLRVALTAEDWARLRECLQDLTARAEGNARHVTRMLQQQKHVGDAQERADRTRWLRDQVHFLALAHDARRLDQLVGRRIDARTGGGASAAAARRSRGGARPAAGLPAQAPVL